MCGSRPSGTRGGPTEIEAVSTAVSPRQHGLGCACPADSVVQAANGDRPFALGMVPVPRDPEGTGELAGLHRRRPLAGAVEPVAEFGLISKALAWVREDTRPYGFLAWLREERIGLLTGPGTAVLIALMAAWIAAYRITQESSMAA